MQMNLKLAMLHIAYIHRYIYGRGLPEIGTDLRFLYNEGRGG